MLLCIFFELAGKAEIRRDPVKPGIVAQIDECLVGRAQVGRGFDQRVENALQVEGRAADDLEQVGGGGLLLIGFVQLAPECGIFLLEVGYVPLAVNRRRLALSAPLKPSASFFRFSPSIRGLPQAALSCQFHVEVPRNLASCHKAVRPAEYAVLRFSGVYTVTITCINSRYVNLVARGRSLSISPPRLGAERNRRVDGRGINDE